MVWLGTPCDFVINPGSVQIYGQNLVLIVIVMIELWLLVALKWFVDYAHFCYIKKCSKIVGLEDRRCAYFCDDQSLLWCFFTALPRCQCANVVFVHNVIFSLDFLAIKSGFLYAELWFFSVQISSCGLQLLMLITQFC